MMAPRACRILVADDQPDVLEALRMLLRSEGFDVTTTGSPSGLLAAVEGQDYDAVLMDLNYARDTTSGREGLDLLQRIQGLDGLLPVVVMTAWGSVESAVEAMRRGARDYVQKPWDNARLLATLRTQIELGQALRKSRRLETETLRQRTRALPELIADSRAMQPVLRLMERVGPSDANVLVTGEHGTGKEVVARWLHAASTRGARPFVAVNAGGLSDGVFESELFGHVRGAFTDAKSDRVGCFEVADTGTLFLDEIANMPPSQQAKLLRVLQTGEFHPVGSSKVRRADVRILSATNVDVGKEVAEGRFREDLLYRLNTVEIALPPLRERREDIPRLAAHFLGEKGRRYGKSVREFAAPAMQALLDHAWPGNVRELEHVVERAVLLASGEAVLAEDLVLVRREGAPVRFEELTLEQAECHLIQRALARSAGNVSDAAKTLGLSRSALYRRLQQYGIKGTG
ncbi:MAG TPA: sigma-54 dependent transcriptional regulator [Polyangia bacterium]|nr:sigma-54 dependent transcriptional regulator [Polyangia bacterium]